MANRYNGVLTNKDGEVITRWSAQETNATAIYNVAVEVRKPDGFWHHYNAEHLLDIGATPVEVMQLVVDVLTDEEFDYDDKWG